MSDIVERLRETAEQVGWGAEDLMNSAADEITRLRAENERLREALSFYADDRCWNTHAHIDEDGASCDVALEPWWTSDLGATARAALAEEG